MKIHKIYIKKLNFQLPNAPKIFTRSLKPKTSVHIEMGSQQLSKDMFEVELSIRLNMRGNGDDAESEQDQDMEIAADSAPSGMVIYDLHIIECGIFEFDASKPRSADKLHDTLIVEGGTALHAYARADIDSTLVKSGFPALSLAMFDYKKVLAERKINKTVRDQDIVIH